MKAQKYNIPRSMSHSTPTVRSIFVVDDEHIIAHTLSLILTQQGFSARAFTSAADAIAAAIKTPPDLLLSDVMMPQITGVQLAMHFRNTYPACRILLFSGQASTSSLLADARASGYDFQLLEKPVYPHDLLMKLRS